MYTKELRNDSFFYSNRTMNYSSSLSYIQQPVPAVNPDATPCVLDRKNTLQYYCTRFIFIFLLLCFEFTRFSSLKTFDAKTKRLPKLTVDAQRANVKKVIMKFDFRKFRSHSIVVFSKNQTNTKILKFPLFFSRVHSFFPLSLALAF